MKSTWFKIPYDGVRRTEDFQGGEIHMEAQVVQGGNGKWTPYVIKTHRGRPRKGGGGYVAGKVLACVGHPQSQTKTKEEAMAWADQKWDEIAPRLDSPEIKIHSMAA